MAVMQRVQQMVQRFGGAMFTPVLLFAFSGIVVALSIGFRNVDMVGAIAAPDTLWYKVWYILAEGAWTVFRQIPLLFAVALPIGLAKKNQARACMEALILYLMFNYFTSAMLKFWGPFFSVNFAAEVGGSSGLTMIANIKTLDTGILGAIVISSVVIYLHDKFYDVSLPEFLGVFRGSSFVVAIGFFVMLPLALLTCFIWPQVQMSIASLQEFMKGAGTFGIFVYGFLERILIPTGLHHFIYMPFMYGPAVVEQGILINWMHRLPEFATNAASLKEMFPEGGFALFGMSKVFGALGMAAAIYSTAKPAKKKLVAGLLVPVTLTAMVAGITEPLEFTFLFAAPPLFAVHAFLAASMMAVAYYFGVVGEFSSGMLRWLAENWLPLFAYHWPTYLKQIAVGLCFSGIYFVVFRCMILKFDYKTPGRGEDDQPEALMTKADYRAARSKTRDHAAVQEDELTQKARLFLAALGGKENIQDVTNCATRLRVTVKDAALVEESKVFVSVGAHGLVSHGRAIQVIVGLAVPHLRERFEALL